MHEPHEQKGWVPPYESSEDNIIRKYVHDTIPDDEERIPEPMNPKCEVAVVVPLHGERQYFLRTLESFAHQQGIAPDQFEIILVVNNPDSEPTLKPDEEPARHRERVQFYKDAVSQNQDTLAILKSIRSHSVVSLSDSERETIDAIRASGIQIHIIDKASPGHTLPTDRANVGGARNRGSAEAVERFMNIARNGIIAHIDGDTTVPHDYLEKLLQIFREHINVIGITGSVEVDRSLDDSDLMKKVYLFSDIEKVLKRLKHYAETGEQEIPKQYKFVGANMAARAFESAVVGGVPEIGQKEDTEFRHRLDKIGGTERIPELVAYPAGRVSDRVEGTKSHGKILGRMSREIEQHGQIIVEGRPISDACEELMDTLLKNDQLRLQYEKQLLTTPPIQLPDGVDERFQDIERKLRALDIARKLI